MRTGTHTGTHFARKRYGSLFLGRARLVLGSIVNAAADGKRLRVIDAFGDLE